MTAVFLALAMYVALVGLVLAAFHLAVTLWPAPDPTEHLAPSGGHEEPAHLGASNGLVPAPRHLRSVTSSRALASAPASRSVDGAGAPPSRSTASAPDKRVARPTGTAVAGAPGSVRRREDRP